MYYIAICDDDPAFMNYLEKILRKRVGLFSNELMVHQYTSGEQLVDALDQGIPFDLLFLDMQMGPMDGDDTASAFREKYPNALLVFCSGVCLPTVKSFEVEAFRYLLKQYSDDKMQQELRAIVDEMVKRARTKSIALTYRNETVFVEPGSILYASIRKHGSDVVLYDKLHKQSHLQKSNKMLASLYEELGDLPFAYPHNSYFVNLAYVAKINSHEVTLIDGTVLTISKSRLSGFKEALTRYFSKIS